MYRLLFAMVAMVSLSACATVTRGTNTAWEVNTDPSGAKVETSHGHQCPATPCSMKMPRKSEFTATITKEGYVPATVTVTNKISGQGGAGMAGNVLVGGIIGVGVDATSGAMLDLTPNPVHIKLEPAAPAATVSAAPPSPAAPPPSPNQPRTTAAATAPRVVGNPDALRRVEQ
jgi:hypothetical protein